MPKKKKRKAVPPVRKKPGKTMPPVQEKPGKVSFLLIAIELLLAVLLIVELFQAIVVEFDEQGSVAKLALSQDIEPYAMIAVIVLALVAIHFALQKKGARAFELSGDAQFVIKETAKIKIRRSKENPFAIALLAVEIAYILVILTAIYFYIDPEVEFAWWGEAGIDIEPPLTTAINIVVFVVITALVLFMHRFAAQFDRMKFQGRKGFKRRKEKGKK